MTYLIENIKENLADLHLCKAVFIKTQKSKNHKGKNHKFDFLKINKKVGTS